MAREQTYTCDICRLVTPQIVFKLFLSPAKRKSSKAAPHSAYTHSLDVGVCCGDRLLKSFNWHPRMTAAEYHKKRKAGK